MKKGILFIFLLSGLLVSCGPTTDLDSTSNPVTTPSNSETTLTQLSTSDPITQPSNDVLKDFNLATNEIYMSVGMTHQLSIDVIGVSYSYSKTGVVSIDEQGVISASKTGIVNITLSKEGYNDAVIIVTVGKRLFNISGTYYSSSMTLSYTNNNLVINDKTIDFSSSHVVEGTDIFEILDFTYDGLFHTAKLTPQLNGKLFYQLEITESDKSFTLMPSLSSFNGYYSYSGVGGYNEFIFVLGNEFNTKGYFDVPYYIAGNVTYNQYYATSYQAFYNDELTTVVQIFDNEDYIFLTSVISSYENGYALLDFEYQTPQFVLDKSFIGFTYTNADLVSKSFTSSDGFNTVTDGEKTYSVSTEYSKENGQKIILNGDNSYEIIPNQSGYILKDSTSSYEYISGTPIKVTGTFITETDAITLKNDDTFRIYYGNYEMNYSIIVKNHKFVYKLENGFEITVINENLIHFYDKNKLQGAVNLDYYLSILSGEYETHIEQEKETLSIEEGLNVISKFVPSNISRYIDLDGNISYKNRSIELILKNAVYPYLEYYEDGIHVSDFVKSSNYTLYSSNYSNGSSNILTIDDSYNIYIGSNNLPYNLFVEEPSVAAYDYKYRLEFKDGDYLIYDDQNIELNHQDISGQFIPTHYLEDAVGIYLYNGPYGLEAFYIDHSFNLSADTLIDNQLVNKQYVYTPYVVTRNATRQLCLLMEYSGAVLFIYIYNGLLEVMDTPYLLEDLFYINGIYVDDESQNIVYVNKNKLYLNGVDQNVVIRDAVPGMVTLEGTDISFNFKYDYDLSTKTNELNIDSINEFFTGFIEVDLELTSFVKNYGDVEGYKSLRIEEVLNPFTNLPSGYALISDGTNALYVQNYNLVFIDGKITMQFVTFDKEFNFIYDSSSQSVTVEVNSIGILPPPPPPIF